MLQKRVLRVLAMKAKSPFVALLLQAMLQTKAQRLLKRKADGSEKKRKASPEAPVEGFEDNAGLLKTATEQGERITGVMEKMQEAQTKQMDMMTQLMGVMLEMMKNEKSSS